MAARVYQISRVADQESGTLTHVVTLSLQLFRVSVVTKFCVEDYADFLKAEFPLHLFQPILVTA
jgi:hypothetical protein